MPNLTLINVKEFLWGVHGAHDLVATVEVAIAREAELVHQLGQSSEAQTTHKFECDELHAENERLKALINAPEMDAFLRGTHIEAVHQVDRWGTAHDRAKRPADWFWLVGYLAGKALHAATDGDIDKAKHHTISTAAALYNWHCSIAGHDLRMCPGRSDLAEVIESIYPGETA
jgi:hypothetical protein